MESLLLLIFSLQGLCGSAMPWEPLAHARLALTPVDATDCRDCEKSTWVSCHAGKSIGSGTFSEGIVPFSTRLWSENKEVFSAKDLMLCHRQTQMVLLPYHFFLLRVFRRNSRWHHNDLGILFLEFDPETLQQLWRETLSLLCSKVYWSCNQKSLSTKDGAQISFV